MNARAPKAPPPRPIHPRASQKTYSHFLGARRMPSDYELVSTDLLYYAPRGGFDVASPVDDWYAKHQRQSPLTSAAWDAFCDPRGTTYTSYTALQKTREAFVDGILASIERDDGERSESERNDGERDASWTTTLATALFPLRYAWHALGMTAAYVGSMAPGGRVAIAALFQSSDELRRVERVAYRMALFARVRPLDPNDAMTLWMRDPRWQPMRETLERLLVTYDFGEAFVALNLCIKPALDEAVVAMARAAKKNGDYLLAELLGSFEEDSAWQRSWTVALVRLLANERRESAEAMIRWTDAWRPRATLAASSFASIFGASVDDAIAAHLHAMHAELHR